VLVHGAAGGVSQLLCAWAQHLGAAVMATVGSEGKAKIARHAGANHVILYRQREFAAEVSAITRSEGVAVAYDAIGRDTFKGSLASLGYFGEFGELRPGLRPYRTVFGPRSLQASRTPSPAPSCSFICVEEKISKPWRGRHLRPSHRARLNQTSSCASACRRRRGASGDGR
jgi:Zinc-binding dehydrogenase